MSKQSVVFKSNLPNFYVIKIFTDDFDLLIEKAQEKINLSPVSFVGVSVIIDVTHFDETPHPISLDFIERFVDFLKQNEIVVIAVMSERKALRKLAVEHDLGVLSHLNYQRPIKEDANDEVKNLAETLKTQTMVSANTHEPRKLAEKTAQNLTIHHPVRSGQRVYAEGDLTIVGSVSRGAEVIAGGNIHVYGKLSGRAIAGANDDLTAAIFCQSLDAELVSIAGNYKQMESIENTQLLGKPVRITLFDEKIQIFSL